MHQIFNTLAVDTAFSRGILLTSGGAVNTKGGFTQLIETTAFAIDKLWVYIAPQFNNTSYFVDIAIGASGQEQVIVPNLQVNHGSGAAVIRNGVEIPVSIPAGSRISARVQSQNATSTVRIWLGGTVGMPCGDSLVAYGLDEANTLGTIIDPGGTTNTKGAWTEIGTTTRNHKGFIVSLGNRNLNSRTTCLWLIDVAIGQEQIVLADLPAAAHATEDTIWPSYYPYIDMPIPSGTRLFMRAQCDLNNATNRVFDGFIYGVG